MPASTAVLRDRKFAPPEAPNRLAEPAPPPKAAPASAPLPCCIRIRPIMPSAERICTARRMVNKTFIFFSGMVGNVPGLNAPRPRSAKSLRP
ncbi:hypothetical protein D9M69_634180 [compost metagenome]